jgi:NAD(P)-dependent dehydrogenase (short-subunit alcohol dehydrogenase family)
MNDQATLKGRIAVVLGGSSGIGRTLALGLARAGADVVPSARRVDALEEICLEIESLGRRTLRSGSDVTDRASLEALCREVEEHLGPVDILVNAAGITQRTPTVDVTDAEWNRILDVNLTGTLRACQVFGAKMRTRGYGRIINIASLSSYVSFHEVAAYGVSKAGVAALTKSLGSEWARDGVRVNGIAPGVFPTDLNRPLLEGTERGRELLMRTPLRRFGDPEELVGACVFLASESASFICGEIVAVDGGFLANGVGS